MSNHQIFNHFILLGFQPMCLMDNSVNIQHWSQILSRSLHNYDILHHSPSEEQVSIQQWYQVLYLDQLSLFDCTHSKLLQKQAKQYLTISPSSHISYQYFMFLISLIGGGNLPSHWFQCVMIQSLVFPIMVQSRLPLN